MQSNPQHQRTIFRTRTYKQHIKPSNPIYNTLEDLTIKAKNLYNTALYELRHEYFKSGLLIPKFQLQKEIQSTEDYKQLPAKTSQHIIYNAYNNFRAFQKATQQYHRNHTNFTGKPKLPRYKKKFPKSIVYFDYQQLKIQGNNHLRLPNNLGTLKVPEYLKGIQVDTSKSNIDIYSETPDLTLKQLRIIPKQTHIELEYVYEKKIILHIKPSTPKIASIDLGLNNFVALVTSDVTIPGLLLNGKGLKSYNQNFNKKLASLQSNLPKNQHTSKRIQRLFTKRNNYFKTRMHQLSAFTVTHLQSEGITHLIVGHNTLQKQHLNLGAKTNQKFYQIPYDTFLRQLQYKCEERNIIFQLIEESYTSGTSFLDNEQPTKANYNPQRRKHRGLFVSNEGFRINSDINASYQILRKAYPKGSVDPFKVNLNTIKLNIPA